MKITLIIDDVTAETTPDGVLKSPPNGSHSRATNARKRNLRNRPKRTLHTQSLSTIQNPISAPFHLHPRHPHFRPMQAAKIIVENGAVN